MTGDRPAARSRAKAGKKWLTSGEVARQLNMTDAAIRRWAREGLVEAIKTPGGQYRFDREAVSRLLRKDWADGSLASKAVQRRSRQ